jgi:hypothetical protein
LNYRLLDSVAAKYGSAGNEKCLAIGKMQMQYAFGIVLTWHAGRYFEEKLKI